MTLLLQQSPPARPGRRAFRNAVTLLQLLLEGLETGLWAPEPAIQPAGARKELRSRERPPPGILIRQASVPVHTRQLVQRMLSYVSEHYSRPMQLGDMAATLGLNAAYLSHVFSTATGVTFHHYLDQFRLTEAQELLRDPLIRVKEVAGAVGYASPIYFCEAFKRQTGVSPSVWRQRVEACAVCARGDREPTRANASQTGSGKTADGATLPSGERPRRRNNPLGRVRSR